MAPLYLKTTAKLDHIELRRVQQLQTSPKKSSEDNLRDQSSDNSLGVCSRNKCAAVLQKAHLSFLLLLPLSGGDLQRQRLLFLSTTLQLAAFTISTHPLKLLPGTEKVNVICTVAQQHLAVVWNGTGVADKITSGGRMGR